MAWDDSESARSCWCCCCYSVTREDTQALGSHSVFISYFSSSCSSFFCSPFFRDIDFGSWKKVCFLDTMIFLDFLFQWLRWFEFTFFGTLFCCFTRRKFCQEFFCLFLRFPVADWNLFNRRLINWGLCLKILPDLMKKAQLSTLTLYEYFIQHKSFQ